MHMLATGCLVLSPTALPSSEEPERKGAELQQREADENDERAPALRLSDQIQIDGLELREQEAVGRRRRQVRQEEPTHRLDQQTGMKQLEMAKARRSWPLICK